MPEQKQPVYCCLCQSAVYCHGCISRWQERSRGCCYCKQAKARGAQFLPISHRPELSKVFDLTKVRCKRYPNCMEIHPLSKIEKHEKISCKKAPCRQCGMTLKEGGKISMQAHIQLHCRETKMQCEFCKVILSREGLLTGHQCSAFFPAN